MEIIIMLIIVVAAVAAVLVPLVRRSAGESLERAPAAEPDDEALEQEVAVYRAALRAGTLCGRCAAANPEGSRYCAQCGRRLERPAA